MRENLKIVRAVYSGLSQRNVAKSYQVSRDTVKLLLLHARNNGWNTLKDLDGLEEKEFSAKLKPSCGKQRNSSFEIPDYEYVHKELSKPHVTLVLLWEEYVKDCQEKKLSYYMETQFRRYYHSYAKQYKATIRLEHKPALSAEVDWAGTKITYYDFDEEEMRDASLFVAVLPASQLIYAEAFRDESLPSWISAHINAFKYWGGVPKTLVPDNLKSGVTKSSFYEPTLNSGYMEMATYYGTVILPARVRKPNDKASVENAVLIASRNILAKLRNVQILSFADLRNHIQESLETVNLAVLTGKTESRWSAYINEEKEYMLPLPTTDYELAVWSKAKVQPNCHISHQSKFYSVPFEYLGQEIEIRTTTMTIEVFYHHERIASHKRLLGKNQYSTVKEHMPPDKYFFADWNRERFQSWAISIGQSVNLVIQSMLDRCVIEQQAYRSCFGLFSLKNKYGNLRLEKACAYALARSPIVSYQQVKGILEKGLDATSTTKKQKTEQVNRGYRRGATFFVAEDMKDVNE